MTNMINNILNSQIDNLIKKYDLDLTGLSVLTEAASGAYFYNPLIALKANAQLVTVYSKDSIYGIAKDIYSDVQNFYPSDLVKNIRFADTLSDDVIGSGDIVTNVGHLRPFDSVFIRKMKPTAVLPLMWEPWEMREGEIDLVEAKERGILVLGTNEHQAPCDMRPYTPLFALKMMMDQGVSIVDDNVLIVGDQLTLAITMEEGFKNIGIKVKRVGMNTPTDEIIDSLTSATYLILAEHKYNGCLVGDESIITPNMLENSNVSAIGVIAGQIEMDSIKDLNISVFPENLQPPGYMSYQCYELGMYPVMDLFTAGLKVAEVMARARIKGLSIKDSVIKALSDSPAMDFEGELAWV